METKEEMNVRIAIQHVLHINILNFSQLKANIYALFVCTALHDHSQWMLGPGSLSIMPHILENEQHGCTKIIIQP